MSENESVDEKVTGSSRKKTSTVEIEVMPPVYA